MEAENIGGEYNSSDDNKSNELLNSVKKPIQKSLFGNLTQKTEENEAGNALYPKELFTEGDFIEEKNDKDSGGSGSLVMITEEVLMTGEANNGEMKNLILNQRKVIESLNRNNHELTKRVR